MTPQGPIPDPLPDPDLIEALARLDRRLSELCAVAGRRSARLDREGSRGWEAVQRLAETSDPWVTDPPERLVSSTHPAFARLADALRIDPLERDLLLVLLAPHVDARYARIYAAIQSAPLPATDGLLRAVLEGPGRVQVAARLRPAASLLVLGLLEALAPGTPLARPLDLAPEVVSALVGLPPPLELHGVPFRFRDGVTTRPAVPLAVVYGPGDASTLWDEIGGGVARLESDPPVDASVADAVVAAAWRWGAISGALPVIDLTEGLPPETVVGLVRRWSMRVARLGGALAFHTRQAMPVAALQRLAPRPSYPERREAWRRAGALHHVMIDEALAARLASASRLGPAAIGEVCRTAGGSSPDELMDRAVAATRVHIPHGTTLEPTRSFCDLVLTPVSAEAIRRLLHFLRHRDPLAERAGLEHRFRLSRGPLVQFAGPSGTGKTLTAEVIASDLGRLLHVVDLARLVSKYIGETERHVDEVLSAAEDAGAVLFFDEADALFSKRTEVSSSNDRYANLEVGYLLQRIESHEGMVILSTNLAGSVDEAFVRRFHARIEFPLPQDEERARIWDLMLPAGVERVAGLDLSQVSRGHRLSGGDIRNAALKAILLAHRAGEAVGEGHLEEAVALELHEQGRLSRRGDPLRADRGRTLWAFTDALQRRVEQELRETFLKEVHVVHGTPTRENLAGQRPAVSLALFRLAIAGSGALRVGFVLAAWANRAEEEHELLGLLHQWLSSTLTLELHGRQVPVRVAESFDFDLLCRFWSSHSQPMKASVVLDADLPDPTRGQEPSAARRRP